MTISPLFFEQFLLEENKKPRTIQKHFENIQRLQAVNAECFSSEEEALKTLHELKKERGLKNNSINNLVSTIKVVARFLKNDDLYKLRYWKRNDFHKATLSDDEIMEIIELPPYPGVSHEDYATYSLFFKCLSFGGMRPGELASLKIEDVDFGIQEFHVRDGKTGARDIPMHDALVEPLKGYIKELSGQYLFPTKNGGKNRMGVPVLDAGDWGHAFNKRIKILGIKRPNLSVYSLRHSFVTRYMEEDINVRKIQRIVGHRKIETTMAYEHMLKKDLHKAMKSDPLGRTQTDPRDFIKLLCEAIEKYNLHKDDRIDYPTVQRAMGLLWESIKA